MVHIVFTLITGATLLGILLRVFSVVSLPVGGRMLPLQSETSYHGEKAEWNDILRVLAWAVFIRLAVYLFAWYIAPIFELGDVSSLVQRWANWDGSHYLNLARYGYDDFREDGQPLFLVFFPLYPWLIRALHLLIPSYEACAYIISNVCFVAGCGYLYVLVANDFSKSVAWRTVVLLSLFPFSFFFGAVRTESLFFLTSAASLYYIRRHRYLAASLWGACAALSRMHGILLGVAAVAEIMVSEQPLRMLWEKRFRDFWRVVFTQVIYLPIMAVGTGIYLLLNYTVDGTPFAFLRYEEEHWDQKSQFFTKTLDTIYNMVTTSDTVMARILWLPELVLFFAGFLVLLYGIRRIPPAYSIYFFVYLFLNYSISWPLSCGRYMSCALPMFVTLSLAGERHPWLDKGLKVVFTMSMALLVPLFLQGKYLY
jgi:hypothetical protein